MKIKCLESLEIQERKCLIRLRFYVWFKPFENPLFRAISFLINSTGSLVPIGRKVFVQRLNGQSLNS